MKKTFRTRTLNGTKFNFIALPDSKYFKFSVTNSMGANIGVTTVNGKYCTVAANK